MGNGQFLPPWVLQVFGMAIVSVFVVVKIKTGQESVSLVSVGVLLITGGTAQGAWHRFKERMYKGEPTGKDPQ